MINEESVSESVDRRARAIGRGNTVHIFDDIKIKIAFDREAANTWKRVWGTIFGSLNKLEREFGFDYQLNPNLRALCDSLQMRGSVPGIPGTELPPTTHRSWDSLLGLVEGARREYAAWLSGVGASGTKPPTDLSNAVKAGLYQLWDYARLAVDVRRPRSTRQVTVKVTLRADQVAELKSLGRANYWKVEEE